MVKRKKKQWHVARSSKKQRVDEASMDDKETRHRTIKHKLKSEKATKIQIRQFVEHYQLIRVQLYELISWMIEREPTTIAYCCNRNSIAQITKFFFEGFDNGTYSLRGKHAATEKALLKEHKEDPVKLQAIKEEYDAIRDKGRATKDQGKTIFEEYKSIYPVTYVPKKYKNESLVMYMVTQVVVSVAEFYALDDHGALKAMTKKTYIHLWSLLYQYTYHKVLNEEQHQIITTLGPFFYTLLEHFKAMISTPKEMIHRVHYLKTLEKIHAFYIDRKTKEHVPKERTIRYGPRASFIPAHLTFEVSKYKTTWTNKWGFDHTFTTDGYSYCTLDKNIEVVMKDVDQKENINETYDAFYGVDPGVKRPLQVASLEDVTHFDTQEDVIVNNHRLNITQDEWDEYLSTEQYLAFVERQVDRIRPYLNQLSGATSGHEYRSILLRPKTFSNITYCYAHANFRQWRFRRYGHRLRRLEYVIQHFSERAAKEQDILWQDIGEERDLDATRDAKVKEACVKRKKRLKRQKDKRIEKSVLLFWGNGRFGHSYKGNKTSSCHQIQSFIERKKDSKVKIYMVCERNTSNSCRVCQSKDLVNIRNERSREMGLRLRRCNACLSLGMPAFFERDGASAKYILDRGMVLWGEDMEADLV